MRERCLPAVVPRTSTRRGIDGPDDHRDFTEADPAPAQAALDVAEADRDAAVDAVEEAEDARTSTGSGVQTVAQAEPRSPRPSSPLPVTADAAVSDLAAGDSIVVQGETADDGTVSADSISEGPVFPGSGGFAPPSTAPTS